VAAYAGFDLGGTQLKYGLIDAEGRILFKDRAPTPSTIEGLLDLIGTLWPVLKKKSPDKIEAAGFGIPGIYDLKTKRILQSPNYGGLDNFDLIPAVARRLDVPFWVDNDANMAAYGEWAHGAGRGVSSMVLLTIGTGIGGGLILGGNLWRGGRGYAGEVGHIIVNPDGARCACGLQGCLEAESSAGAIIRKYAALTRKADVVTSSAITAEDVTAEDIYNRAKGGEKAAREAFARAGYYLGIGLGILINLLNPEKILLGGGVMTTGEYLLAPAVEEAAQRSYRASFAACSIERAGLGNDAGVIGAASWARKNLSRPE
jgi:glucokinase